MYKTAPGPANFTLKPLLGFDNHDINSLKKRAPQWSLGVRLKDVTQDKTPGANKYDTRKITRFGNFPNVPATISHKPKERSKIKPLFCELLASIFDPFL